MGPSLLSSLISMAQPLRIAVADKPPLVIVPHDIWNSDITTVGPDAGLQGELDLYPDIGTPCRQFASSRTSELWEEHGKVDPRVAWLALML